jgi:hypothetical protein
MGLNGKLIENYVFETMKMLIILALLQILCQNVTGETGNTYVKQSGELQWGQDSDPGQSKYGPQVLSLNHDILVWTYNIRDPKELT